MIDPQHPIDGGQSFGIDGEAAGPRLPSAPPGELHASAMLRRALWGLVRSNIPANDQQEGPDASRRNSKPWLTDVEQAELSRRLSHDPALGLAIGLREISCLALGASRLPPARAQSFARAVSAIVRSNPAARDRQHVFVFEDEETLTIQVGPFAALLSVRRFMAEASLVAMRGLLAQFAGHAGDALDVCFDYPAPQYAAEYDQTFGCRVRFDQLRAALIVPRALADREKCFAAMPTSELSPAKRASANTEGCDLPMADRLRQLIRECWNYRPPRITDLSRQLGLSERSLRRQLANEGSSFRNLVAEARWQVASQLLTSGVSVKETAYHVGYRSSGAFYRAFRRWAGASPTAFASA